MIKRHGLVVFLFCFSIITGITIAILEAAAVFFFSTGILFLGGMVTALFGIVLVSWLALKRNSHIRDPEQSVRHQSTAFGVWFAAHNLFWAFLGSFFIWGIFKLFGFRSWVMVLSAGALACTCFALIGTFLIQQRKMLGLCWQSAVPDGLQNFWARAAAAVILWARYEYAAENDQKQRTPILWSISRIFNRSTTGGADRGIDLMEPRPGFLSNKLKKEWLHRFKVLLVLFWITAALAALPGLLGFASQHWHRVPEGWPSDKIKDPEPDKDQMMASKSKPDETSEKNSARDKDKQTDQDQEKQSSPDKDIKDTTEDRKDSETGESKQGTDNSGQGSSNQGKQGKDSGNQKGKSSSGQEAGDSQQGSANQGQENKEKGKVESTREQTGKESQPQGGSEGSQDSSQKPGDSKQGDSSQEQKGKEGGPKGSSEQSKGDPGQEQKGEGKPGQQPNDRGEDISKPVQEGKSNENKGKDSSQGQGKEKGTGAGDSKPEDSSQGQPGKGESSQDKGGGQESKTDEPGQSGPGQGQDGKSGQSEGEGEGGGKGKSQDQSEGARGSEQKSETGEGKTAGKGTGEGQGLGDPNHTPEMSAEPEPIPQIPSRATDMVTLELPTLEATQNKGKSKGSQDPQEKTPIDKNATPQAKAPTAQFETGKQERRASKPDQYLPNWILNLLKQKKPRKK